MTLERLGDGIEWVRQRLGVYPIWNCAIRLPDDIGARFGTRYLVDIGIYGEPMVRGYTHMRDMRALQLMVDSPALWGTSYLTWDEIRATNSARYERYDQARVQYKAAGAFMNLKDKVVWIDPAQVDLGKIPMWRLRRTFGPRWYLNPLVYPLLAAVYLSKLIWR